MESDIVARLRVLASEFPTVNGWMDNEWKNAADEIERLREALRIEQEELAACCIDRKETQRERDEARRELDGARLAYRGASYDRDRMRSERDEARRLYINEMCLRDYGDTSARIREANARGWICFDSDGWSDPGDECQREAL